MFYNVERLRQKFALAHIFSGEAGPAFVDRSTVGLDQLTADAPIMDRNIDRLFS